MNKTTPIDGVILADSSRIAKNATLLHDVRVGDESSIWPGVVARGDHFPIIIGARSNVQDNCIIHVSHEDATIVGNDVTIGHGAILHGCTIHDRTIVGMGSIIMDGAEIGEDCLIGAGALIPKGVKIPPKSVVMGMPGKVKRQLTDEEIAYNVFSAKEYVETSGELASQGVFFFGNNVPEDLDLIRLKRG